MECGGEDANARATRIWQRIVERGEGRPEVEGDRVAALEAFIAKRTGEGGAAPES